MTDQPFILMLIWLSCLMQLLRCSFLQTGSSSWQHTPSAGDSAVPFKADRLHKQTRSLHRGGVWMMKMTHG